MEKTFSDLVHIVWIGIQQEKLFTIVEVVILSSSFKKIYSQIIHNFFERPRLGHALL